MADFVLILFYLGGFGRAYRRSRAYGKGRIAASLDAIAWPYSLGRMFARLFFTPID